MEEKPIVSSQNTDTTTEPQAQTTNLEQGKIENKGNNIPRKYPIVIIFLVLLVFILSITTFYFYNLSSNNKEVSQISVSEKIEDTIQQISPTLTPTITITPLSTVSAELSDVSKILDDIVSNYPDSDFRKINSRTFEYQIDESTKKIILGTAYESEITGNKESVEKEIYNEFISLGFAESMHNAAGPDFGAVRYGVQKDNIVCIIKTGFPYSVAPNTRILDVDCGTLED